MNPSQNSMSNLDFNKTKPDSIEFLGEKKSASTWHALYVTALRILAAKHPYFFIKYESKTITGTSIKIGNDRDIINFLHPYGILKKPEGGWLFVETDYSAQQISQFLEALLKACNEPLDSLVIFFSNYLPQNMIFHQGKSGNVLIRKTLPELTQPLLDNISSSRIPTVEEQYVQWLIKKGEKPSKVQFDFSMAEKTINRLQISSRRLFSISNPAEIDRICSFLKRSPQWRLFSPKQQEQILHSLKLYYEFRCDKEISEENSKSNDHDDASINSPIAPQNSIVQSNKSEISLSPASSDIVDFHENNFTKYNVLKPLFVEYLGERKEKKLWQPLYLEVCKCLTRTHSDIFFQHNQSGILGTKPEIVIGSKPLGLRMPGTVMQLTDNQFIYIETGYIASDILLRIKKLLDLCVINYDCLKIGYRSQKKDKSTYQKQIIDNDPLLTYLNQQNVRFHDLRKKSGCLWIYGKHEHDLDLIVQHCWDEFHVAFTYNNSTRDPYSWWTKDFAQLHNLESEISPLNSLRIAESDPLLDYLNQQHVRFHDYRKKSGCLWIYGAHEHDLDLIVHHCWNEFHIKFTYNSSAKGPYCWWTKDSVSQFVQKSSVSKVHSPNHLEASPSAEALSNPSRKENLETAVPDSVIFNGQQIHGDTWRELYVSVAKELYLLYPGKFISIAGHNNHLLGVHIETSDNVIRLQDPAILTRKQWLYIETKMSPQEMIESLRWLLDWCGLPQNTLKIHMPDTNGSPSTLKSNSTSTMKKTSPMPSTTANELKNQTAHEDSSLSKPAFTSAAHTASNVANISKLQRYITLLKESFPDGFKAGSAIATKKMQIAYQNKYGEEPAESKEEIMTIVQQVGTLRDGRIYPRNQSQLLSEINSEILRLLNVGATCVYCDAVFDHYRERLADEQHIYNSDALRDPLLDLAHRQYCVKYGTFCLPDREADISLDVLMCMRSHPMPATYDDLREELWYIPLDKIKKALMDDPAIVNVGDNTYFYAPNLPVSKEEQRVIASQLESELGYHSYTTTAQLMKLIHEKCPTVEINTEGLSTLTIRNSLSYLLRKSFNFRSNIISSITTQPPVDTKQAFREFCREHETMTTAELQAFADEVDTVIYWDSVFSEMIRISERDWVRKDHILWTPEAIDAKLDEMCEGDYLIIKDVCLFLQFPVVGYRWNSFLLESYVNSYSPTYKLLHASFSAYDCCGAIVKKSSQIKNYHDLAVDVLANDDAWKDQQSALQTLVDKGLQQRRTLSDIVQVTKEARLKREKRQKEVH